MIGFTIPVTVYVGVDDSRHAALLTLDMDSVPDKDVPDLDIRLADNDDVIVTCTVEDALTALNEIQNQVIKWERSHSQAGATV